MIGRTTRADHRCSRRARGAIASLAFGVGHRGVTDRFARHDFHSEALRHETLGTQARFLKRQLSLPVSTMSQWWVSRSRSAVVIFGSPNTLGHSPKARFVVTTIEVRS